MALIKPPVPVAWTNWVRQFSSTPSYVGSWRTIPELIEIVQQIVDKRLSVRVTGSGHSTTRVALPRDVWLRAPGSDHALDDPWRNPKRKDLVRVLAGTRVKTLNLDILGSRYSIPNMGSFDGQTLGGALSTGTHGSSLYYGPMADHVRSVDLVTVERRPGHADTPPGMITRGNVSHPKAVWVRIERKKGPTLAAAFRRDNPEAILIKDDAAFSAAVVNFGSLGIVHAYTLSAERQFWLKEDNRIVKWGEVKRGVSEGGTIRLLGHRVPRYFARGPVKSRDPDSSPRYVQLAANVAWAQKNSRRSIDDMPCLLTTRYRIRAKKRPAGWVGQWPPQRRPWSLEDLKFLSGPGNVTKVGSAGAGVNAFFAQTVAEPPFMGLRHASVSHLVFRRLRDETGPDEEPKPPRGTTSNEIAVPIGNTIAAVERLVKTMRAQPWAYVAPLAIRFVGPSIQCMAPQVPVCWLESFVLMPKGGLGKRMSKKKKAKFEEVHEDARAMLTPLERTLCYARNKLDGVPHWGQYNTLNKRRYGSLFKGQTDAYHNLQRRFNHYGTFSNDFTDQVFKG